MDRQLTMFPDERIREQADGTFLVASKSAPGSWHRVGADGACDCLGYAHRATCRHVALLVETGRLVPPPAPAWAVGCLATPAEAPAATLWTARYQHPGIGASGLLPVQTSLGAPKFRLGYPLVEASPAITPERFMLGLGYAAYERAYRAKLDRLGVAAIEAELAQIRLRRGGAPLVLLCFDDVQGASGTPEWCHRRMFAKYYEEQTGIAVPEFRE